MALAAGCTSVNEQLITSSRSGNIVEVKQAVERGADINFRDPDKTTPLANACSQCRKEVAGYLLEKGADVNAGDDNGFTPLIHAVFFCDVGMVKTLVEKKAPVNHRAKNGMSPLHYACRRKVFDEPVFHYLLVQGADPNLRDNNGRSPLFYICDPKFVLGQNNTVKYANMLIDNGARINDADDDGNNPLHLACRSGIAMLADELIKKGASISQKNKNGDTPLNIVKNMIIRYERNAGSRGKSSSLADMVRLTLYKTTEQTLLKAGAVE
jgi:ankyrin repeat protein